MSFATASAVSAESFVERTMHGFHASNSQCSYGMAMHLASFALAGVILGIVVLIW